MTSPRTGDGLTRGVLLALILVFVLGVTGCSNGGGHPATTHPSAPPVDSSSAPSTAVASPTRPTAATDAVATTPVRVAHTAKGSVGYRSVGEGSPIVLIMGFGGTLNAWTPTLVASLARTHRVITFDNSGIGRTAALPSPLSITAMAGQTAALLATLHIPKADILGWSLGGMIAQALAIEHPELVSHLVLAATYPGNGKGSPPTHKVVAQLTASVANPALILPLLFPAAATAAQSAYVNGIFSWSEQHSPSTAASAAEGSAATAWIAGDDPTGRRLTTISSPTLVLDGADDVLVPAGNTAALTEIPGSAHTIYPASGHAFLFQDQDRFLTQVTRFVR